MTMPSAETDSYEPTRQNTDMNTTTYYLQKNYVNNGYWGY